ncbi:endonuclease NucS domain-containing protein [Thalassospira aquimaris]|uniref:Endonuclease NucS n=1 Tax=Thalassospira aquimaris TaxID=3037796 RepID=A0ABT6GFK1_9PROT|nr:endonuclease NucS domain-containing protein [Thalassospira sp. FZY0004]MDG4720723.1 endonuclease NucS [Thalassospira sp. FZY0004]
MSAPRSYYRIMLGQKSAFAAECYKDSWFGGDWGIAPDLSHELSENWRDFNTKFIPVFLEANPEKSKVAAGLACGMLHTICKGIQKGDIVLCPDGTGSYWVGEVIGDYYYVPDGMLRHRRKVQWFPKSIARADMSEALQRSTGSIGTVSNITKHAEEIERFLAGHVPPTLISTDELVEDPSVFALEKHLEDFLVRNWASTELGKSYNIFEDEGEPVGQQYPTDTGPIDILALRKDGKEILVVELKKGRASDAVVGQVQRYMGYVLDELAEPGQSVRGCIIALEDDLRLRRALRATNNIDFYRYQVSFKLFKGG